MKQPLRSEQRGRSENIEMLQAKAKAKPRPSKKANGRKGNKNATVHGVHVSDTILPWECKARFKTLHSDLCAEFRPRGRMEEECVLDLAHLRWQKERIRKMYHVAAYEDPFVHDLIESGKKTWKGIRNYVRERSLDARTLTEPLRQLSSQLASQAQEVAIELLSDKASAKSAHDRLEVLLTSMSERVWPLIQKFELGPNAENTLKAAYSPASLEPILRLEVLIDGRIDKALGRLANLKAFKALNAEPMLVEHVKSE